MCTKVRATCATCATLFLHSINHLSTARVLFNHVLLSLTSCLRFVTSLAAAIGSIPEVPAESCNEVKMSEKGRDGKYWLSSIIPGTPVFAYCDMKTGGKSN